MSFYRYHCFVAIVTILFASSLVGRTSETLIQLGGLRKAAAKIQNDDSGKSCEISFVGVQAFDTPTNKLLNQSKSKFYAVQAFAKDHKIPQGARFSCAVRRIGSIRTEGERVTSFYRLDSISLSYDDAAIPRENSPESSSSNSLENQIAITIDPGHGKIDTNILTAISEMTSTLIVLVASLQKQIDSLQDAIEIEELSHEVADLESTIQETVQSFDAAVTNEEMLLESEKNQLKALSQEQAKQLISALATRYETLIKSEFSETKP